MSLLLSLLSSGEVVPTDVTEYPSPIYQEVLGSKAFKHTITDYEEEDEEIIFAVIQAFLQCH